MVQHNCIVIFGDFSLTELTLIGLLSYIVHEHEGVNNRCEYSSGDITPTNSLDPFMGDFVSVVFVFSLKKMFGLEMNFLLFFFFGEN